MRHYTCDLCGHPLKDERFVAKVQVVAAFEPDELDETDLDADNLQEVADLLEHMEAHGLTPQDRTESREFEYDLCAGCRDRYLRDPLGRDALRRLDFSKN